MNPTMKGQIKNIIKDIMSVHYKQSLFFTKGQVKLTQFKKQQIGDAIKSTIERAFKYKMLSNKKYLCDLIVADYKVEKNEIWIRLLTKDLKHNLLIRTYDLKSNQLIEDFITDLIYEYLCKIIELDAQTQMKIIISFLIGESTSCSSIRFRHLFTEGKYISHYSIATQYIKKIVENNLIENVNFDGQILYYNNNFVKQAGYHKVLQYIIHQLMHYHIIGSLLGHNHGKQNTIINTILEEMKCEYILPLSEAMKHESYENYIEILQKRNGKIEPFIIMEDIGGVKISDIVYVEYKIHLLNNTRSKPTMYVKKQNGIYVEANDLDEIKEAKKIIKITEDLSEEFDDIF